MDNTYILYNFSPDLMPWIKELNMVDFNFLYIIIQPFKYDYNIDEKDGMIDKIFFREYYVDYLKELWYYIPPKNIILLLDKDTLIDNNKLKNFYIDKLKISKFIIKTKEQEKQIKKFLPNAEFIEKQDNFYLQISSIDWDNTNQILNFIKGDRKMTEKIPYVEFNAFLKQITFYYKNPNISYSDITEKKHNIKIFYTENINYIIPDCDFAFENELGWINNYEHIETAIFDESFKDFYPISTANWFYGLKGLKEIKNIEFLNTSSTINMKNMFLSCSSLVSLDLHTFDTSNVTTMSRMFEGCEKLQILDISNFSSNKLAWLDVNDAGHDNAIVSMFWQCHDLKTIYIGDNWKTTEPILKSGWVFAECNSLIGGKGSTPFDPEYDGIYARIDEGIEKPGYFTYKNNN